MRIFYLHGLKGHLTKLKKDTLDKYGSVTAPRMDYFKNNNVYDLLKNEFDIESFDVIIGSSMGGFIGFYLSWEFNKASLLFNPALPVKSVHQQYKPNSGTKKSLTKIVLGAGDPVIPYKSNLQFLDSLLIEKNNISVKINSQLQHRIPPKIFGAEVAEFFNNF